MSDIGKRAAEQVRNMAELKKLSLRAATRHIDVGYATFYTWEHGQTDPGAYVLARMLETGYDINYILLGKENNNA